MGFHYFCDHFADEAAKKEWKLLFSDRNQIVSLARAWKISAMPPRWGVTEEPSCLVEFGKDEKSRDNRAENSSRHGNALSELGGWTDKRRYSDQDDDF